MKFEKVIIKQDNCFNLKDIFECGQCFRWKEENDGSYTGIVSIGVLNISYIKDEIIIKGYIDDKANLKEFATDYLDLNTDCFCDYKKLTIDIIEEDPEDLNDD